MRRYRLSIFLLIFTTLCNQAFVFSIYAEELTIAAASDLNFAIKEVVAKFEAEKGAKVKLSLGSSGNFFAQIQNGAPFDLYLSADMGYPKKLEEAGLTVPGTLYRYAVGRIVVWVPKTSHLEIEEGPDILRNSGIKKISIANPKHAPYGRAAVSALNYFKIYDLTKDRLVLAENVSQAAQFVESGAADLGIIALSLALAPTMKTAGRYWEVPSDAHLALEQGAVILKRSTDQELAKQFLEFMKGPEGQEIMRHYGFTLPD